METALTFIPNYVQTASCFIHGETFNQKKINDFLAVCKCSRLFVNSPVGISPAHIRLFAEFEFST